MSKSLLGISAINLYGELIDEISIEFSKERSTPGKGNRNGYQSLFEDQLLSGKPGFARIYGFSFEGSYYHLPHAVLYLVNGEGQPVTKAGQPDPQDSRAPRKPEISGVGAADFDYSDDIRYWTYDREDFSIRFDVETGTLNQVLLEAFLGGEGVDARGINARGINARGINARGINARGINARGINARGINARGGNND